MTVVLRAFRVDEVDALLARREREIAAGVGAGPATREEMADRVVHSGAWSDTPAGLWFAVEADGSVVGDVQARRGRGMYPSGVIEIGIDLYEEADRGRGIGRAAVAELTARLFDREEVHRVQLSTDVDNRAMRRVAELLGFRFEGVLRGFMPSPDGARDYAMYGMTEADFHDVRPSWTSTS